MWGAFRNNANACPEACLFSKRVTSLLCKFHTGRGRPLWMKLDLDKSPLLLPEGRRNARIVRTARFLASSLPLGETPRKPAMSALAPSGTKMCVVVVIARLSGSIFRTETERGGLPQVPSQRSEAMDRGGACVRLRTCRTGSYRARALDLRDFSSRKPSTSRRISTVCSPRSGERTTSEGLSDILIGLPTVRYFPRAG